ncbi:succinylglutamate desuccinylase/aspartoacylase family protein [Flagellimonas sediminis]|uniref:Aspartoacylase n=1 Tax=Flagellimonas sediminis TaxID=2696468 RepID=A0A6I5KT63_9FLAO|nr:succinylglutamate desuccinylase/aspartoacylase family protein [Allomuricauda sediminis]NDV43195.1 aspartoacylase [Allomuricauda sediminis]
MCKVHSIALNETIKMERVLDHLQGTSRGPTVVFFGGIHGNEPAGVFALRQVFQEIRSQNIPIQGEVYAITGNLGALSKNLRYQQEDLNRIWLPERITSVMGKEEVQHLEEIELKHLYQLLQGILENSKPPFYFLDLHTTSSDTIPFMVMNDSLLNRKYASHYPLPIILGIEEYLEGALLSYINELGYVSLGFESGQHNDGKAIQNCIAFIRYSMALTETILVSSEEKENLRKAISGTGKESHKLYEIYHQHLIAPHSQFKMLPGFVNFQSVPKWKSIAIENGIEMKIHKRRQIFMPLYQEQGNEGFYFIRPIPKFLLWMSKELRRFKVDHLLVKLPGVQWKSKEKDTLMVDQRVARFFARSFLHLLGYRARKFDATHLVAKNRERASKTEDYQKADWFNT